MKKLVLALVLLVGVAAVVKTFIWEIPSVGGTDMAPTLQPGDRLLAYRLNRTPAVGDLVLLTHPSGAGVLLRRVVAIPGDRIAVRGEVPLRNGAPAQRQVIQKVTLTEGASTAPRPMLLVQETLGAARYLVLKDPRRRSADVPEQTLRGSYYVLADNRNHGTDSRTFGPVPAKNIRSVVSHRLSAGPGVLKPQVSREGWVPLP